MTFAEDDHTPTVLDRATSMAMMGKPVRAGGGIVI
jgi:hypothetical protein